VAKRVVEKGAGSASMIPKSASMAATSWPRCC
jgi:hypothetical protein